MAEDVAPAPRRRGPRLDPACLPLPRVQHVPGSGTQPDHALLERVKKHAPERTEALGWAGNRAYRYGWSLLEAGFPWEAHEIWETVWRRAAPNSPERTLLRGLIQLANAELKCAMGRRRAAGRLLAEAREILDDAYRGCGAPALMGVERDWITVRIEVFEAHNLQHNT